VKCDAAFPCATQNEISLEDAKTLIAGGVKVVAEGANMPTESASIFQENACVRPGQPPTPGRRRSG
jgi:glutamate dehydrogenase (NADP+)